MNNSGKIQMSAVILAGGKNSRFGGKPKSMEKIGGRRIIDRISETLLDIFSEVLVVTAGTGDDPEPAGCRLVKDIIPASGPLGGIHAAMLSAGNDLLFVIAGDMPFPDQELIKTEATRALNSGSMATVPVIDGKSQFLHSVYHKDMLPLIEEALDGKGDLSVARLLKQCNTDWWTVDSNSVNRMSFVNINTPEDADRYR